MFVIARGVAECYHELYSLENKYTITRFGLTGYRDYSTLPTTCTRDDWWPSWVAESGWQLSSWKPVWCIAF